MNLDQPIEAVLLERGKLNANHVIHLLKDLIHLEASDLCKRIPELNNKEITFRLQRASEIYKGTSVSNDIDMFKGLMILKVFGSNLEGEKVIDISKMKTAYMVNFITKEIKGFLDSAYLDSDLRS
ncbi:hypothetical protein HON22_05260 [Candidatus Peregrinibacteria bacterium]|jgi:hypothetical protein|nr:hypothetical protein [Candidatus Peregrinibacteria bacterium]